MSSTEFIPLNPRGAANGSNGTGRGAEAFSGFAPGVKGLRANESGAAGIDSGGDRDPAAAADVEAEVPARPETVGPASNGPGLAGKPGEVTVAVDHEGDRVRTIQVRCACGRCIELDCV